MTSTSPAICINFSKITDQIVGTQREIVPGDLIKVINGINSDRTVIKMYDRASKTFGKQIYQCDKEDIKLVEQNAWTLVSEIKEGSMITLIPEGEKVNFRVIRICDVPTLGPGRFFALDINDALSEDDKFPIRMKYYNKDQAAYCIRADRIIDIIIMGDGYSTPEQYSTPQKFYKYAPSIAPNMETRSEPEVSLIDFTDESQNFTSLKTPTNMFVGKNEEVRNVEKVNHIFNSPSTFGEFSGARVNQMITTFHSEYVDPQLQHLKNGLSDLRTLTEKDNGMNEYGRSNKINNQINQNFDVQNINLIGSTTYGKHNSPPSDNYYSDAMQNTVKDFREISKRSQNNVPPAILQKLTKQNSKTSLPDVNCKDFQLPVVQRDNEAYHVIGPDEIRLVAQTTQAPNYTSQINANKKPKARKNNRKMNLNDKTKCYKCHKSVGGTIQLDCQHVFCPPCLLNLMSSDLDNARCPFKNGSYSCQYKLQIDDVKNIIEAVNSSLSEPSKNTGEIQKQKLSKENHREVKKAEDVFVYDDNGSNEVLFKCKKLTCNGMWFIDKTEGRSTYPCSVCGTYNCFKCGVIHENMTCDEYNQHNHSPRSNRELENRRPTNVVNQEDTNGSTWQCKFCTYDHNQIDTAICVLCARTDDEILNSKNSDATEYYRLLAFEENDNFIPNFDEFECVICADIIEPANGVQIRGCLHNFCQNCLRTYIEGCDQPDIKCPFDGCSNVLEDREIKTLISQEAYARHLEISLRFGKQKLKNGYQCCVPNCQGWWIFTEGIFNYSCPVCRTENCISCKASHPRVDCKKYQQDLFYSKDRNGIETKQRLEQMLRNGEAEHCPTCNIIVVKNGGCAHMVCSMCRTKFNWGQKTIRNLNIK